MCVRVCVRACVRGGSGSIAAAASMRPQRACVLFLIPLHVVLVDLLLTFEQSHSWRTYMQRAFWLLADIGVPNTMGKAPP